MKFKVLDLVDDITGTYDQTKTTIQGRVTSKTIDSQTVLGPPVTKFIDNFTDSAITPTATLRCTSNNHLFVCGAYSGGLLPVILYDFNLTTGAYSYVGKINITLPNVAATTQTIRSLYVINDSGTTGWDIYVTTVGSVTINGGLFLANKVDKADFIPVGATTIPFATGNDQKAVYFLQDPANIGVGQLNIASAGATIDTSANRIYIHNGTAATHQYYVYDTGTTPTYTTTAVTVSVASPGIVADAGHSYAANTPVVFTAGTLPTGLTVGTVYFVRNPIAGVSYELSATSGGASINTTGSPSVGATLGRAFGTTGNLFVHKTGNLPALTGTLLLTDSEKYASPVSSPLNGGTLNGQNCVAFGTSSNLYMGLLSELTSGAVTWPSLTTSNLLGAANEVTAPTAASVRWSPTFDAFVYTTNTIRFVIKKLQNNVIISQFGNLSNVYYEGITFDGVNVELASLMNFGTEGGWIFACGNTVGQRGVITFDAYSDHNYDYSYLVTKVITMPNSLLSHYTTLEKIADITGNAHIQYRTSGFGSISGGWTELPIFEDLSSVAVSNQIQFKISSHLQDEESTCPPQINELIVGNDSNSSISDNWEFSDDWSDNNTPSRTAFRLKEAYSTSVPTLYYRAYDLSDALLVNHNTSTNPTLFEYSTNNGTSWNPLGTIPNTVGTLVRYTFTSPPGVDIRPGLKNE